MKKTNMIIGLVIFAVLVTVPFWSAILSPANGAAPEVSLDTPAINQMADAKCVEDVEWMRAHHMDLLNDWKVEVVREGTRVITEKMAGTMMGMFLNEQTIKSVATPLGEEIERYLEENGESMIPSGYFQGNR